MRQVYRAADIANAELVRGLLLDAGIRSVILGEALGGAVGDIPFSCAFPQVCVDDENFARARELILESGIDSQACPTCGETWKSNDGVHCAHCGAAGAADEDQPAWKCPSCGETLPGQFSDCWKCGSARPSNGQRGTH